MKYCVDPLRLQPKPDIYIAYIKGAAVRLAYQALINCLGRHAGYRGWNGFLSL